ncbi:MAG: MATE family efflux transporter, partial [Peptococcaceae bacterium]|nr:MATE family efflux transporter [Peptococcaceae bacterium]
MKVQSMTTGKIAPLLITFALPLMAGNIFQELYTVVDTMIVGQFLGVAALAAVGNGGWITWMLLGAVQGFTQGFANPVAQAFGAGDKERVRKNMANSIVLTAVISLVLLAIGEAVMIPLLKLLNTPAEIFDMSLLYLRIYYAGTPVIMAYNYAACHLRALGNSKDPLVAMIIASLTNIVLDILFVGPMGMGIAGAVIATVISQVVAAVYSFICLFKIDFVYFKREYFVPDAQLSGNLLYMGLPMALQNVILSVGGLIVQFIVNQYGIIFIAGMTATNRLYGLLETAGISYGYAISTYVGQNRGAGEIT